MNKNLLCFCTCHRACPKQPSTRMSGYCIRWRDCQSLGYTGQLACWSLVDRKFLFEESLSWQKDAAKALWSCAQLAFSHSVRHMFCCMNQWCCFTYNPREILMTSSSRFCIVLVDLFVDDNISVFFCSILSFFSFLKDNKPSFVASRNLQAVRKYEA